MPVALEYGWMIPVVQFFANCANEKTNAKYSKEDAKNATDSCGILLSSNWRNYSGSRDAKRASITCGFAEVPAVVVAT
jgi:hypothetical protein